MITANGNDSYYAIYIYIYKHRKSILKEAHILVIKTRVCLNLLLKAHT